MENHLNAVLVLYTKKAGFATCFLTENENQTLCYYYYMYYIESQ